MEIRQAVAWTEDSAQQPAGLPWDGTEPDDDPLGGVSGGPQYLALLAEYLEVAPTLCEADRDAFETELAHLKLME